MKYAIIILVYILIMCAFGYAIAVKNENVCEIIERRKHETFIYS